MHPVGDTEASDEILRLQDRLSPFDQDSSGGWAFLAHKPREAFFVIFE